MISKKPITTSFVIPSYNGKHLLETFLPSVVESLGRRKDLEIIVVDDGSSDGTCLWLREAFPQVTLLALPENLGFGKACHEGIRAATAETIILLNNDVSVCTDIPGCLENVFQEPDLFAVAFDMLSADTYLPYANRILPIWRQGLISFDLNGARNGAGPSFYGCGGGMAFNKTKYLALGGFHPIFQPFYWEDTDLCYRAWKRGWRIVFHPECTVRHYPSSTIRTVASERRRTEIIERNRLLFLWKNLSDLGMLMEHVLWLFCHLLSAMRRKDAVLLRATLGALKCLPQVMRARAREKRVIVKGDREIFAIFAN